jgi:hypothetical protein
MKMKATVLYLAVGLVLTLSPMISMAQSSGQFAVAQPPAPFLPTRAPAIATRVPFAGLPAGSGPIVIAQPPASARNPFFTPGHVFSPTRTVVPNQFFAPTPVFGPAQQFVPNPVFAPTQAVIPNQFVAPMAPTQLLVPGQTVIPPTTFQTPLHMSTAPPAATGPAFVSPSAGQAQATAPRGGMSRADVLRMFGQPSVTVTTSTSETLYFRDGTTVTLQNGQVTGSK